MLFRSRTSRDLWTTAERFELMVGFAATFAEDLFRQGRLRAVAVDEEPSRPVRGVRDLEDLLDRLAVVEPSAAAADEAAAGNRAIGRGRASVVSFVPEGPRGVAACADGRKVASA